jgi:hypothetical protein
MDALYRGDRKAGEPSRSRSQASGGAECTRYMSTGARQSDEEMRRPFGYPSASMVRMRSGSNPIKGSNMEKKSLVAFV